MVDLFQLFKLGTNAAKVMKATKHVYDAKVIFDSVRKPLMLLGVGGFVDAASEEYIAKLQLKLTQEMAVRDLKETD